MGDTENALPPSKKRAAGREISRDDPGLDDEEDSSEQETGTFKRASDEVLANRRIFKVRRNQSNSTTSSNPFSGIRLVPATEPTAAPSAAPESGTTTTEVTPEAPISSENQVSEGGESDVKNSEHTEDEHNQKSQKKADETEPEPAKTGSESAEQSESKKNESVSDTVDVGKDGNEETKTEASNGKPAVVGKTEDEEKKEETTTNEDDKTKSSENADSTAEGASFSSFQQLSSSQNAFTGLAGTGFSTSSFSFGSTPKDDSSNSIPLFGQKNDQPAFSLGLSTNGSSSLFNTSSTSIVSKSEGRGIPSMQEVPVETGEENEKVAFSADSVLFEFIDGVWKERGKGELKVNVSTSETEKARLVMRTRGNYRLILNASLYPDMKLTNMDKKGITFACMNCTGEEKEGGLSTFALKFKDGSIVEIFRAAVMAHKGKTAPAPLKTPENSPKASEG